MGWIRQQHQTGRHFEVIRTQRYQRPTPSSWAAIKETTSNHRWPPTQQLSATSSPDPDTHSDSTSDWGTRVLGRCPRGGAGRRTRDQNTPQWAPAWVGTGHWRLTHPPFALLRTFIYFIFPSHDIPAVPLCSRRKLIALTLWRNRATSSPGRLKEEP